MTRKYRVKKFSGVDATEECDAFVCCLDVKDVLSVSSVSDPATLDVIHVVVYMEHISNEE